MNVSKYKEMLLSSINESPMTDKMFFNPSSHEQKISNLIQLQLIDNFEHYNSIKKSGKFFNFGLDLNIDAFSIKINDLFEHANTCRNDHGLESENILISLIAIHYQVRNIIISIYNKLYFMIRESDDVDSLEINDFIELCLFAEKIMLDLRVESSYMERLNVTSANFKKIYPSIDARERLTPGSENLLGVLEKGKGSIHVVTIFDGVGDFFHMANWIASYSLQKPDEKKIVIMSYNNEFHREGDVRKMIASLGNMHILNTLPKEYLIICNEKELGRYLYNNIIGESSLTMNATSSIHSLYAISYVSANNVLDKLNYFASLGLNGYLLNEFGMAFAESAGLIFHRNLSIKICNLGIGYNNIGCFIPDIFANDTVELFDRISPKLEQVLFDDGTDKKDRQKTFSNNHYIVGYYQENRDISHLVRVVKGESEKGRALNLILTGIEHIPDELQVACQDIKNLKIKFCKLDVAEYNIFQELICNRTNVTYFCSGDNSVQESIALGMPLLFLSRKVDSEELTWFYKQRSVLDCCDFMQGLSDDINVLALKYNINLEYANVLHDYIDDLIRFSKSCIKYDYNIKDSISLPSIPAKRFFHEKLAPFIKKKFNIKDRLEESLLKEDFVINKKELTLDEAKWFLSFDVKGDNKELLFSNSILKRLTEEQLTEQQRKRVERFESCKEFFRKVKPS